MNTSDQSIQYCLSSHLTYANIIHVTCTMMSNTNYYYYHYYHYDDDDDDDMLLHTSCYDQGGHLHTHTHHTHVW